MSGLIFPTDPTHAKNLSKKVKTGKLKRLFHGVYTEDLSSPLEKVVSENWMELVGYLVPGGILSHRTALELAPAKETGSNNLTVFITSTYSKRITRGPLVIKISSGNTNNYTEYVLPGLMRSNTSRAILENLASTRARDGVAKTLDEAAIEDQLARILMHKGDDQLNRVRDEARIIADQLDMPKAFAKLNLIVSSLLSTQRDKDVLQSDYALAVAHKEPYDTARMSLFKALALYLNTCSFRERSYHQSKSSWRNLSFFESYFSNYIEGTKFLVDEAEDIVFKGATISHRHSDSHDILAVYHLTSDLRVMSTAPETFSDFLSRMKGYHATLMKERPDKRPGLLKEKENRAGNTVFVSPAAVLGTLERGFKIYQTVGSGMPRALFMMMLIAEVHPFDDGNGRIARIFMNTELVASEQVKCIVPTVHRDNYLGGLRRFSRDKDFQLICQTIDQAHAYTESISWAHYSKAREKLEHDMADKEPDEGLPQFNRALRQLKASYTPA